MNNDLLIIFLVCLFVLGTAPLNAQTGILGLPAGKKAIGFGFQQYDPPTKSENNSQDRFQARNIRGSLDYHFNETLKISFIPSIAFLSIANQDSIEVPPSPSAELRFTATGPLDASHALDYFLRGSARMHYAQIHNEGRALEADVIVAWRAYEIYLLQYFIFTDFHKHFAFKFL